MCHELGKCLIGFKETSMLILQFGLGGFSMVKKHQEVFKQYDFKIYKTYRIRGAHIIETNKGPKLFKRLECSKRQVEFENKIQEVLVKKGHPYVDLYVSNSNDEIITTDSLGNNFLMKDWNSGKGCDLRDEKDVLKGVSNLAKIHKLLRNVPISDEELSFAGEKNLIKVFEKRTRELMSLRSYIRGKRKKNEFEICFLDCYEFLLEQAVLANKLLKKSQYNNLLKSAVSEGHLYHGNYTYHNLIILDKKTKNNMDLSIERIVTSNFEKAVIGIQINDLYHFMRKTMEKNDWNINLGNQMIVKYNSICKISKNEAEILYILLLYPEKFWKISNYYYNGKKAWVPKRTIQKINDVNKQKREKDMFLKELKERIDMHELI